MNATATAPTEALILTGEGYGLSIAPDAISAKAELIQSASAIVTVTSAGESDSAREQVKLLAAMRNLVEKSRKAVKDPVLKVGKDIDAKASEFVAEIETEEKRLTGLIGSFAQEQEKIRREEARKAEAARLEAQRLEEEKARLERERIAAEEKARKEAEGKTGLEALQAEASAEEERQRREEEDRKLQEASDAAKAAQQTSIAALVESGPKGVSMVLDFEVLDAAAFFKAYPDLCKIEVKRAETLARLKATKEQKGIIPEVVGLRVFETTKVSTR